jgi:hypothetical protein
MTMPDPTSSDPTSSSTTSPTPAAVPPVPSWTSPPATTPSNTPSTAPPADTTPPSPPADASTPSKSASDGPTVGSIVTHTYFDAYDSSEPGGAEITVHGIVVDRTPDGVMVALLDVRGPIPPDELTVV